MMERGNIITNRHTNGNELVERMTSERTWLMVRNAHKGNTTVVCLHNVCRDSDPNKFLRGMSNKTIIRKEL